MAFVDFTASSGRRGKSPPKRPPTHLVFFQSQIEAFSRGRHPPPSGRWATPHFEFCHNPMETVCHWLFYLIVISGFQTAGSLNSSKIAQERGPLPGLA